MLFSDSLANLAFAAAGYLFFCFVCLAAGLVLLGLIPRNRTLRERQAVFALSLIAAAGLIATGWPFCETLLLPWLRTRGSW